MASTTHLSFSPLLSISENPIKKSQIVVNFTKPRLPVKTHATGTDLVGDFGARDPFPAEIESNFGEKVLGNVNTEHKILIPTAAALSLSQQQCTPISHLQQPIPEDEAKKMLFKVVGWRIVHEDGGIKLQGLWKLRDFKCAVELINRICRVVESTGHFPTLHLEQPNQVRAELWTASIGGLSTNDFIVAAKIDEIQTSDLVPRKRVWACELFFFPAYLAILINFYYFFVLSFCYKIITFTLEKTGKGTVLSIVMERSICIRCPSILLHFILFI